MTDKSDAEMSALEEQIEGITCLLCEFHRQQAIRRKTESIANQSVRDAINTSVKLLAFQRTEKLYKQ